MPEQTQPFPTNQTSVVVNQTIDGVIGVAIKATQVALVTADPAIFGLPVIKDIDNEIIQLVGEAIYKQIAQFVSFEIIDFTDAHEVNDQQKALIALKAAQKSGDKNALIKALADFDKATEALTHIDGAGSK